MLCNNKKQEMLSQIKLFLPLLGKQKFALQRVDVPPVARLAIRSFLSKSPNKGEHLWQVLGRSTNPELINILVFVRSIEWIFLQNKTYYIYLGSRQAQTEPWWLSSLERQSNSRPMLKVESSNQGVYVSRCIYTPQ